MHEAIMAAASSADVVIMAAAVADFTPASPSAGKVAKADGPLTLTLNRTRDILARSRCPAGGHRCAPDRCSWDLRPKPTTCCGRRARSDVRKGVDLIVANDVSQPDRGFDVDTNAVTLVSDEGDESISLQSKDRVAAAILDRVERLMRTRTSAPTHR